MKKFQFNISISANNENEAATKMKALAILASRLTDNELKKLAEVIQNDPVKTAIAKKALGV